MRITHTFLAPTVAPTAMAVPAVVAAFDIGPVPAGGSPR